jgi:hypothetical protein
MGRRRSQHDGELVPSEPRDRSTVGDLDEPRRDIAQQLVARVVTERVVVLFLTIEVDEEHSGVLPLLEPVEGTPDIVVQLETI